ncbi:MAG: isoprenylcysteine carboxylmethyltransferase family protein [Hyphomicrobiales bacterium]|nr:isoprenylcysteine carboxylmethyltransferase family protein [Hyphomicrobiales bacterium]
MIYGWIILASWLVLIVVWFAMARRVKIVAERESAFSTLSHYGPLAAGIFLISAPRVPLFPLDVRFVPLALWPVQLGAAVTVDGAAFAIWARALIAGNWSSSVTLKRDHELIVEGPYRIVRHPIYTGILLGLLGTAFAVGEWRALLGVMIAAGAYWRKLKIEEGVMRRQFGKVYAEYAARVPALVPFVI